MGFFFNGVYMLKKTSLAVLGLIASGVSLAGSMGPVCTPGNVTVPCIEKRWDLGVRALYLRSLYDADIAYSPNVFNGYTEIKNDWDWGVRLEGSYHFNTGNDISLNWTHYHGNAAQASLLGTVFVNPFPAVPASFSFTGDNKFDQVNLEMGQLVNVSAVKKMRFYGGLQYASIQADATNYYNAPFNILNLIHNTDFKGVGPVAGIDYSYYLTNAFSVTANGSTSILYGTSRYSAGYVAVPLGLVTTSIYASKKSMVPSLEAKLGLNYAHHMGEGELNIEGGYQALNYFNALQGQRLNGFTNTLVNSDYSLYGPYFGIKYIGAA